jgi:5-methylcytosine-specific restriction endonuclease McrA
MAKLGKSDFCPIHRSRTCCGREAKLNRADKFTRKIRERKFPRTRQGKWYEVHRGLWRIEDLGNPRGYREKRSPREMRRLLDKKIVEQKGLCGICGAAFEDYGDVTWDHIEPRRMGGAWRDDHPANIQAAHSACNLAKGSRRL